MKVLLYTELEKMSRESGLGKSVKHQEQALRDNGVEFTRNSNDTFDIVHINFYGPRSYALAKKCKKKGIPVVYHAHSTEEDFRNSFILSNQIAPLFKKWIVKCYSQSDLILTPTPYSQKLLEGYGLHNIHALSNGVDTEFFKKNPDEARRFRELYGFSDADKVIVGIGLYLERKGILDFIEIARALPEYKFIWFGHTSSFVIPSKIKQAIKSAPSNLQFPGHVPASMIRAALSSCNLYIFPTLEETEGIPIVEACSVGTPTLIRDIPVFDPWMKDGINTYKAKTLEEFIKKTKQIVEGDLPDLTKAAHEVAMDRDIRKIGQELISLYKTLLQKKA